MDTSQVPFVGRKLYIDAGTLRAMSDKERTEYIRYALGHGFTSLGICLDGEVYTCSLISYATENCLFGGQARVTA